MRLKISIYIGGFLSLYLESNSAYACNLKGDFNCSGDITVTDGVSVLRCAIDDGFCNSELDAGGLERIDMDCNGSITVTDGVLILEKAAGFSHETNCPVLTGGPRPLLCGSFNVTISDDTLNEISKWQVVVLDYYQGPREIGEQLKRVGTGIKAFFPIYHEKSDSIDEIYERTRLFAEEAMPYLDYMLGVYVWDEPDYDDVDFDKQQAAIDAVRLYLPGISTFMYLESDNSPAPEGLTYRGMHFYNKDSKDIEVVRKRLEHVGKISPHIIAIPRAFDDNGHCCDGKKWSDTELAQMNRDLFPELSRSSYVAGVIYFVWNIRKEDDYPKRSRGTEDLPETLETIRLLCTH